MTHNDIDFNNKTILITGGAGFIGSNLAFYFQNNFPSCNLVVFDCFRNEEVFSNGNLKSFGHFNNLIGFDGDLVCGDITQKADLSLLNNYKFDYIFHQAAISDTRVNDQEIIMRTNVNSFYDILNLANKDKSILIYASSAATYGSLPPPQTIGNERPENPYGYSKYIMDQIAHKYSKKNPDMKIVGLRFFNVYGFKEFYKATTSSMIIQLGHQILESKKVRLFQNSDKIFRDFVFIEDVIQANIKACNALQNGVFNVGTGIARSFKEIVDILEKELNTNVEIEFFRNPYTNYQLNTQADISLTRKYLGFNPEFSLEAGIKSYISEIQQFHNQKS
mgnify:CR=1 FL=1